ncbi:MAG TPA: VanZ family protein [Bacteroidia bacterium]|nr:VanZ family protein [Bacteroidia bacterium]
MFLKSTYPALIWALVIAILCGIPGKDIPHFSYLELLQFDKLVHASVFFVLTVLLLNSFTNGVAPTLIKSYAFLLAGTFCVAYGGLLEILQGAIFSERTADIFDFIANSFGCMLALIYYWFFRSKHTHESKAN